MSLTDAHADQAAALLDHYSFDLTGYCAAQWVQFWQQAVATDWIHAAVIEALYQGRYKAISVEQLLRAWQRRQEPIRHFSHEFERMVCSPLDERFAYGYQQIANCLESSPKSASQQASESEPQLIDLTDSEPRSPVTASPHSFDAAWQSRSAFTDSLQAVVRLGTSPPPIEQFVPLAEDSDFYTKLCAVAHQSSQ
ncbi:MAG: hypothetical protein HC886_17625 [Leptolyngbyaceae cyanobacterium SM1_1_3]|nr:hypothetical protein [Leptolyngbyaceae cyanobacterium SM1_1_3]NJM85745.1 hypothetical protein [Leptolyngbyaceae cyanobacterium RM2_2_21]NJN03800.1 hypothetical protein [Leptolyngbyaceae cyanobacterium RM1_1_2]NJO11101.1 hypothetical protein [Leptolyngbyaceae cyanobacterium SL_1_1]